MAVDPTIWIAGIALAGTLASPVLMSFLAGRQRQAERAEAREDAKTAQTAATEAARLLVINNDKVAKTAADQSSKMEVIHTLVNSNLTASKQAEFDAKVITLAALKEVVDLKKSSGQVPSPDSLKVIDNTTKQIADLRKDLDERLKAAAIVEKQLAKGNDTTIIADTVITDEIVVSDAAVADNLKPAP